MYSASQEAEPHNPDQLPPVRNGTCVPPAKASGNLAWNSGILSDEPALIPCVTHMLQDRLPCLNKASILAATKVWAIPTNGESHTDFRGTETENMSKLALQAGSHGALAPHLFFLREVSGASAGNNPVPLFAANGPKQALSGRQAPCKQQNGRGRSCPKAEPFEKHLV